MYAGFTDKMLNHLGGKDDVVRRLDGLVDGYRLDFGQVNQIVALEENVICKRAHNRDFGGFG
jgi:hypothetical protein